MTVTSVNVVNLYKSLADETRLRILNLLRHGPLCVCHVQEALDLPQSKVSKQLSYLKKNGLLISRRYNNWTIYEMVSPDDALISANLEALAAGLFAETAFLKDLESLGKLDTSVVCAPSSGCC